MNPWQETVEKGVHEFNWDSDDVTLIIFPALGLLATGQIALRG